MVSGSQLQVAKLAQIVGERLIGLSVNRPIHRIGKFEKFQYRIGIVSANYKGKYRLISNCLF